MTKEKKIKTVKFTRPDVSEELTEQNIKDIVESQKNAIKDLESEIARKKECIKHYNQYL